MGPKQQQRRLVSSSRQPHNVVSCRGVAGRVVRPEDLGLQADHNDAEGNYEDCANKARLPRYARYLHVDANDCALRFAGVSNRSRTRAGGSMNGVVWATLAGLFFGLHQAFFRQATSKIDASRATLGILVVAGTLTTILGLLIEDLSLLRTMGWFAPALFAVTGMLHFTGGWTLLGLSQQRIGASRTGIVISASPLIGTVIAALFLDEPLTSVILIGVLLVSAGVALIARERAPAGQIETRSKIPWHALAVATIWGFTPVMIRRGLEDLPAPLLGVAIGMFGAAIAGLIVVRSGLRPATGGPVRSVAPWIMLSGTIVGLAITSQWQAFDAIEISVAVTLFQISTPVVVFAAPLIGRAPLERPTPIMLGGMAAIVAGSVLVILS